MVWRVNSILGICQTVEYLSSNHGNQSDMSNVTAKFAAEMQTSWGNLPRTGSNVCFSMQMLKGFLKHPLHGCTAQVQVGMPFSPLVGGTPRGALFKEKCKLSRQLGHGVIWTLHCIPVDSAFFFFCSCNMKPFKLVCNQSISCQQNRELVRVECRHPAILYHPCFRG